jgi:DNA repair protein RecN (Recombination protein N)
LLDESGRLGAEVAAMRDAFRRWRELDLEREAFAQRLRDRDSRIDLLAHYVAELDALSPQADEPRLLAEERRRISSVGRLAEGTAQAESLLAGDAGDVAGVLGRAQLLLRNLSSLDPELVATERLLEEAAIACREAIANLRRYADSSTPIRHARNGSRRASPRSRRRPASIASRPGACRNCAAT